MSGPVKSISIDPFPQVTNVNQSRRYTVLDVLQAFVPGLTHKEQFIGKMVIELGEKTKTMKTRWSFVTDSLGWVNWCRNVNTGAHIFFFFTVIGYVLCFVIK